MSANSSLAARLCEEPDPGARLGLRRRADTVCTVQAGVQMAHWRRGVVASCRPGAIAHVPISRHNANGGSCRPPRPTPTPTPTPTIQPGVLRSSVSEAASYDTMRDFDLLPFFPTCLLELLPPQPRCHPPTPPTPFVSVSVSALGRSAHPDPGLFHPRLPACAGRCRRQSCSRTQGPAWAAPCACQAALPRPCILSGASGAVTARHDENAFAVGAALWAGRASLLQCTVLAPVTHARPRSLTRP